MATEQVTEQIELTPNESTSFDDVSSLSTYGEFNVGGGDDFCLEDGQLSSDDSFSPPPLEINKLQIGPSVYTLSENYYLGNEKTMGYISSAEVETDFDFFQNYASTCEETDDYRKRRDQTQLPDDLQLKDYCQSYQLAKSKLDATIRDIVSSEYETSDADDTLSSRSYQLTKNKCNYPKRRDIISFDHEISEVDNNRSSRPYHFTKTKLNYPKRRDIVSIDYETMEGENAHKKRVFKSNQLILLDAMRRRDIKISECETSEAEDNNRNRRFFQSNHLTKSKFDATVRDIVSSDYETSEAEAIMGTSYQLTNSKLDYPKRRDTGISEYETSEAEDIPKKRKKLLSRRKKSLLDVPRRKYINTKTSLYAESYQEVTEKGKNQRTDDCRRKKQQKQKITTKKEE